jgi:uncharacterized protein (TIRG00374 family)
MEKHGKIWLIIFLTVAVYLALLIYADFGNVLEAIRNIPSAIIFIVFLLTMVNNLVRFIRWNYFLRQANIQIKIRDNLIVFFSGLSMTLTPGKIGELWKCWFIREINGEELCKTVPIVIVDRLTDVLGLVILCMVGIFDYFNQSFYLIAFAILIPVGLFIAVKSDTVSNWIISFLEKRTGKYSANIRTLHNTFKTMLKPASITTISIFSAFGWFFECLGMYIVVLAFREQISLTAASFVYSFASLAGGLSFIPGGLGITEGSISGLLQISGFAPATAVGIAIVVRIGTMWFAAILGLVTYLIFARKTSRKIKQPAQALKT